ncbi:MAG: hypothetical protein JW774_00105 [Candidatus Aureabacteria bacterium]|nr:hypothetical protein [Candidatus Auribacterota bacterium]
MSCPCYKRDARGGLFDVFTSTDPDIFFSDYEALISTYTGPVNQVNLFSSSDGYFKRLTLPDVTAMPHVLNKAIYKNYVAKSFARALALRHPSSSEKNLAVTVLKEGINIPEEETLLVEIIQEYFDEINATGDGPFYRKTSLGQRIVVQRYTSDFIV